MKIDDYISEMSSEITDKYIKSLNNEEPVNLDKVASLLNDMTELAIHILRVNPEFRAQFARIHSEFLKYPECKQVIDSSIEAISQYRPEMIRD